jgi:hypothetical protein
VLDHNIWYQSIDPRVFLLQASHLRIFTIIFFSRMIQNNETWRLFRIHIKVSVVKISASGSLYFQRYTLWKIRFLTSPITSLKQVFWVKLSYILHEDPNLVRLVSFERGQFCSILVQVSESDIKYWVCGILYKFSLLERPKINKVWESYPNFTWHIQFWSDLWH